MPRLPSKRRCGGSELDPRQVVLGQVAEVLAFATRPGQARSLCRPMGRAAEPARPGRARGTFAAQRTAERDAGLASLRRRGFMPDRPRGLPDGGAAGPYSRVHPLAVSREPSDGATWTLGEGFGACPFGDRGVCPFLGRGARLNLRRRPFDLAKKDACVISFPRRRHVPTHRHRSSFSFFPYTPNRPRLHSPGAGLLIFEP